MINLSPCHHSPCHHHLLPLKYLHHQRLPQCHLLHCFQLHCGLLHRRLLHHHQPRSLNRLHQYLHQYRHQHQHPHLHHRHHQQHQHPHCQRQIMVANLTTKIFPYCDCNTFFTFSNYATHVLKIIFNELDKNVRLFAVRMLA